MAEGEGGAIHAAGAKFTIQPETAGRCKRQQQGGGCQAEPLRQRDGILDQQGALGKAAPLWVNLGIQCRTGQHANNRQQAGGAAGTEFEQAAADATASQHHADAENKATDGIAQRGRPEQREWIVRDCAAQSPGFEQQHADDDQQQHLAHQEKIAEQENVTKAGGDAEVGPVHDEARRESDGERTENDQQIRLLQHQCKPPACLIFWIRIAERRPANADYFIDYFIGLPWISNWTRWRISCAPCGLTEVNSIPAKWRS